ncbi:uncharacterized protein LOC109540240 [Dendroctonus ponderosae]|nr:uncharacterized protein LOC109540240 [Dendroctonus ponderosae]KAH1025265.1 hypothetical protein HUJ05_010023 [Dendroctonus ponderosae]
MESISIMEHILNPKHLQTDFVLSQEGDKHTLVIDKTVIQQCGRHDIYVLDFLCRSWKNELNGVILNVEEDFNPQLQLSLFLGALHKSFQTQFRVLVVCPDEALLKWHYHLTTCGSLQVKRVTEENVQDPNVDPVLLLSFSNIKLVESLLDIDNCTVVVVDKHDQIVSKRIMRTLQCNFNIGITFRNFYTEPDQKLQWTMLNWAHPGCVGKLADFYQIDNDNFNQFRDNYKEWWFRLTWSFCESFAKPTMEENGNLIINMREWAKDHNLGIYYCLASSPKKGKRKTITQLEPSKRNFKNRTRKLTFKNKKGIKQQGERMEIQKEDEDSNETVIYGNLSPTELDEKTTKIVQRTGVCENSMQLSEKEPLIRESKTVIKMEVEDDEADIFLKSVTSKSAVGDLIRESEQFVGRLLTNKPLKLETDTINNAVSDSDNFLKEISSTKYNIVDNSHVIPNDKSGLSNTQSDVDKLIAEALEMVSK